MEISQNRLDKKTMIIHIDRTHSFSVEMGISRSGFYKGLCNQHNLFQCFLTVMLEKEDVLKVSYCSINPFFLVSPTRIANCLFLFTYLTLLCFFHLCSFSSTNCDCLSLLLFSFFSSPSCSCYCPLHFL